MRICHDVSGAHRLEKCANKRNKYVTHIQIYMFAYVHSMNGIVCGGDDGFSECRVFDVLYVQYERMRNAESLGGIGGIQRSLKYATFSIVTQLIEECDLIWDTIMSGF